MSSKVDSSVLIATIGACLIFLVTRQASGAGMCGDGALDADEECDDGNVTAGDCCSPTCLFEPPSTVCRPAAGPCDVPESCSGASDACPSDGFVPAGMECRSASGSCDVVEACPGDAAQCPTDAFASSVVVCRPSADACDVAETCSGASAACPDDLFQTAGTPCAEDGVSCTDDVCDGGGRCAHAPVDARCEATTGPCTTSRCDAVAGCVATPSPDGAACHDGDECTADDRCAAGTCVPGPVRCATVTAAGSRILVECVAAGRGRGRCSAQGFVAPPHPAAGTVVTRLRGRRIGKSGTTRLAMPLSRGGRRLLASGGALPLRVEVIVLRDGEGAIVRRDVTLAAALR